MFIRKKIMIVDGVEMNRQFLRYILTNAGYITEATGSGSKALALLDDNDFDIFFVDIHMPELKGIKFIKTLRGMEDFQSTPIAAVTTANPAALKQKGDAIGITEWVKKPISPPEVFNLLKKLGLTNSYQAQSLF